MAYDSITVWASHLNIPLVTAIATILGNDVFFGACILFLAFVAEKGKKRNRLLVSLLLIYALGFAAKHFFPFARPCADLAAKIRCPTSPSFPSTTTLMAFAVAMAGRKKRTKWLFVGLALFIGFTRIYLGVHTLADVLGGMALGITAYYGLELAWRHLPENLKKPFADFLE